MVRIIIGGDLCPLGNIAQTFISGNSKAIFNDLFPIIEAADFNVINLECPLIRKTSSIKKDGIVLGASYATINGLKNIKINAVNLANNHIMDHNEQGLISTTATLNDCGIRWFGAGRNLEEARRPLIQRINDRRFGFIGIAEHEFSIARNRSWGANPIDVISIIQTIREYRTQIDHLIILVHGGKEHYHYPSPRLQKLCRFMIDEGADAVICQHSHCAGSYEYFNNKLIVYGQGDLVFERLKRNKKTSNKGFLVSLEYSKTNFNAKFIPFRQADGSLGVQRLSSEDESEFLSQLDIRSENILSPEFIEQSWIELCCKEKYLYASRLLGHTRLLRFINSKIHFTDWAYSKKSKMISRNVVECEIHREGLETLWRNDLY